MWRPITTLVVTHYSSGLLACSQLSSNSPGCQPRLPLSGQLKIVLSLGSLLTEELSAVLNLTLSQIWPGTERLLSTTFGTILPKLYAMSMMWTLNARLDIRTANVKQSSGHVAFSDSRNLALQVRGHFTSACALVLTSAANRFNFRWPCPIDPSSNVNRNNTPSRCRPYSLIQQSRGLTYSVAGLRSP